MKPEEILIRETSANDFADIMDVEKTAFGGDAEAELTAHLLADASAEPRLSLLAFHQGAVVGHVLFTRVRIEGAATQPLAYILAPLAVMPDVQKQGIGGMLIRRGLQILREKGAKMVFVLGHKEYYPRHGFVPNAMAAGYPTPYPGPAPDGYAEHWMIQRLTDEKLPKGRVICADTLHKPELWQE